jgi:TRAP-type C4-dicarboxylate transport system substrate-binding protein
LAFVCEKENMETIGIKKYSYQKVMNMKIRILFYQKILVLTIFAFLSLNAIYAQKPVVIKFATMAPKGSPWHLILQDMGVEWQEATNGNVEIRIYPGGVVGSEQDMVRKMRIGQLHAAAVSSGGLSRIVPGVNVLCIPAAIDSSAVFEKLCHALQSDIEQAFEEKGFLLLTLGDAGWVHHFTSSSDPSVEAAQKIKMYVTEGDDRTVDMWKKTGFNAIPLAPTDILMGLQTGMIEAYNTTAMMALAFQWFAFTPYMVDVPWAPMIGGTVITKKAWDKIPHEYHDELRKICDRYSARLQTEIRQLEEQAIAEMEKRGLTLLAMTEEEEQAWRDVMESGYPMLRTIIPNEWFDTAIRISNESRGEHGTN